MRRAPKRSGLTLLELLCVMAILIILLSVAYPSIEGMSADIRQTAAADQVRTVFAEARARAIEDGQAYRFAIKPGEVDFRVAPDRPEFWEGGDAPATEEGAPAPYIKEGKLDRVTFQLPFGGVDNGSGWTTVVTFMPDGTCDDDAELHLHSPNCRPVSFRVRALTGAIRVRTLSAEEIQQ